MSILTLYPEWQEARLIRRLNRFVMELELPGKTILAYIPNTGRMSEFLIKGQPFYITDSQSGKYRYRVVSTCYQGNYVFLDTVKVNDIFHQILLGRLLDFLLPNIIKIQREVHILNSRFDFRIENNGLPPAFVEIKSCTLCHNGIAMFPDAPTVRGQKHILELQQLSGKNLRTYIIYLIMNGSAKSFYPNFHTDYNYGKIFRDSPNVEFHAISLNLTDPVSIDLNSLRKISIDKQLLIENCVNKGNYFLLLENKKIFRQQIGKLDCIEFPKGYYIYVGSALNSLDSRLKRHHARRKNKHWHIDYIIPYHMQIKKVIHFRRTHSIESKLAGELSKITDSQIDGFGASDSPENSHLFYFRENPIHHRTVLDIILNAQTFTLTGK